MEEDARAIGAINCIYKDKDRKIIGTNTDGAGALWSLHKAYGDIYGSRVMVLGAGGASAAVTSYVGKIMKKKGKIFISNRSQNKTEKLIHKLSNLNI